MATANPQIVKCPTCHRPVPWLPGEMFKPFCSERCRLIDLGDWATEAHKIPGESLTDEDSDLFEEGQWPHNS